MHAGRIICAMELFIEQSKLFKQFYPQKEHMAVHQLEWCIHPLYSNMVAAGENVVEEVVVEKE